MTTCLSPVSLLELAVPRQAIGRACRRFLLYWQLLGRQLAEPVIAFCGKHCRGTAGLVDAWAAQSQSCTRSFAAWLPRGFTCMHSIARLSLDTLSERSSGSGCQDASLAHVAVCAVQENANRPSTRWAVHTAHVAGWPPYEDSLQHEPKLG